MNESAVTLHPARARFGITMEPAAGAPWTAVMVPDAVLVAVMPVDAVHVTPVAPSIEVPTLKLVPSCEADELEQSPK